MPDLPDLRTPRDVARDLLARIEAARPSQYAPWTEQEIQGFAMALAKWRMDAIEAALAPHVEDLVTLRQDVAALEMDNALLHAELAQTPSF